MALVLHVVIIAVLSKLECMETGTCRWNRQELANTVKDTDIALVSVLSYVFDVSSAPHFYGKHGRYHYLRGTDGSRSLATQSRADGESGAQYLGNLTPLQWEELFSYAERFNTKYSLVGRLTDWDPGVTLKYINELSGMDIKPPTPIEDSEL
eukprot:TRINITY_DN1117_c0_g2_i1.p1 TRINITY_DN1117_c0_g2~~TRINITY_DN1117_c0_g2_i1.p1  ORF type:complete len:152 (+),score=30.53 TRINITY_DN1117_c0_g2_i1:1381-1836(+)